MKISKKTSYGLIFMLNLATAENKDIYTRLSEIAEKEGIPEKFLENIVALIRPSGLLNIKRGVTGGYKLSKSSEDIRIIDIFKVLNGELFQQDKQNNTEKKQTISSILVENIWRSVEGKTTSYLSSISLYDLAVEYKKRKNQYMFYI